uniref:MOSC domain-containing protein n=1 Tax=Eiseniibacteriota bacterium TaxID=2212470 RepID=A0A832MMF4_UNCEI
MSATVTALHLAPARRAPVTPVPHAVALADAGLEGDHHARPGSRRQVLLMDDDTLRHFALAPGEVREQVTVRGLDVHALAPGTRLAIGEALFEVAQPCDPCAFIEGLRPGLQAAMQGRRGRFVRVVRGGRIAVGDAVSASSPGEPAR